MRRTIIIFGVALALGSLIAAPAFAGKPSGGTSGGGGKGGKTTTPSYTGTFSLVLLNSTDGTAHYGQNYTFNVQTNAPYPFVRDDCYQNGTLVYTEKEGFYPGWVWGTQFNWSSSAWTAGAADCTATLYYTDSSFNNPKTMGTLSIHVFA